MSQTNDLFSLDRSFSYSGLDDIIGDNLDLLSENSLINFKPSLSDIVEIEIGEELYFINKETYKKETIRKDIFKTEQHNLKRGRGRGRGRKANKETKNPRHTYLSYDNILSKIQNHFLNFVTCLINDCVLTFGLDKNIVFLKFDYSKKSKASSKYFNKMKNSSIKDLVKEMGISDKYKRYDENTNETNLEKLIKYDDWFKKFFEIKFLDLFSYYYNKGLPLEKFSLFDKAIFLSRKTKSFYWLLEKYKEMKGEIIEVIKISYINEGNTMESC